MPKAKIFIILTPIKVIDVKKSKHSVSNFIVLDMLFPTEKERFAYIRKELYIVNDLRINVFINIDILYFKRFIVDFQKQIITIANCVDLKILISIIAQEKTSAKIFIKDISIILPKAIVLIFIVGIKVDYDNITVYAVDSDLGNLTRCFFT